MLSSIIARIVTPPKMTSVIDPTRESGQRLWFLPPRKKAASKGGLCENRNYYAAVSAGTGGDHGSS